MKLTKWILIRERNGKFFRCVWYKRCDDFQ